MGPVLRRPRFSAIRSRACSSGSTTCADVDCPDPQEPAVSPRPVPASMESRRRMHRLQWNIPPWQFLFGCDLFSRGPCCTIEGECVPGVSPEACTAFGGSFQGDGTDCDTVECPAPEGWCCPDTTGCFEFDEETCRPSEAHGAALAPPARMSMPATRPIHVPPISMVTVWSKSTMSWRCSPTTAAATARAMSTATAFRMSMTFWRSSTAGVPADLNPAFAQSLAGDLQSLLERSIPVAGGRLSQRRPE